MKPEETFDFHIRWAWHRISKLYNNEAGKHGGSMSIGYALLNIDQKQGTPSTSLGPKMGMEPTSLSRTLKTMEEGGLITRQADNADQRIVRVFLTKEGRKNRDLAKKTVITFNEKVQAEIPNNKLTTFFEVMTKVNIILDKNDIFENGKTNN